MVKNRNQGKGVRDQGTGEKMDDISGYDELESKWAATIDRLKTDLAQGLDVAFITLGDPTIYSTFYYLYEKLTQSMPDLRITVIPGISSINASAAAAGIPLILAEEKIAVLPATYEDDIRTVLQECDTFILMKVHRVCT